MEPASPGARLSNYRLDRLLGAGGMGTVHLAHDLALDRPVAIKFVSPEHAADDSARRRLIQEARAAAALEHPNICGVHEVIVEPDGTACIVMQYVEGETLAEKLREGSLDVRTALTIAIELAGALAAAHKRGILHRDIKPQNIIITPDRRTILLDFGLAKVRELRANEGSATTTSLTLPGDVAGTPGYMSPEQAQQRPLHARSDLFSLGAVLFECLTGQRAFAGGAPIETLHRVLYYDPPAVSSLRPGLTEQHDELCRRLLEKNPEHRFQSAEELLGALRVVASDSGRSGAGHISGLDRSLGSRTRVSRFRRRALELSGLRPFAPRRAAMSALAMLVVVAAVAVAGLASKRAAPASPITLVGILPFRNESGDAAQDRLAVGLTDALAKRLETVPSLRVLPLEETREAMREWSSPAEVARSIGAGYVIDGALMRAGSATDVAAALITADGRQREVGLQSASDNLIELQRGLTEAIVAALIAEGALPATATAHVEGPTESPEAFAEYSQARTFLERPDVPGNLDHAIRLFLSAIAKDPRFALAHAGLGEAYWAQFRETRDPSWTAKAMAANLEALRIDPNHAEVRMSLAVMYDGMGRQEDAIEELETVMDMQPQNDNPHRLLSGIHISRGEWDAAIASAKQAADRRPTYWRNHSQLGLAYFRAGRYEEAAAAYERLIELQPDSARGYQALGTALQAAGRNDDALRRYEEAIAIRPSGRTYSNIGTLHFWRGDYQKAAEAYEKAVALLPNDSELHANLGDARSKLGQMGQARQSYQRAVEQMQKLLSVSPNDPQYLASLALYRAKLGEHTAAAAAIQKAIAGSPKDGQVQYAAALVHALRGETVDACKALGLALENGASSEEIRHASELKSLKGCASYDRLIGNGKK